MSAKTEGNYSRHELISWLQDEFQTSITKIEECSTGAMYLQIFDAMYPMAVPMNRVNWDAKLVHESFKNFKLLQEVFSKVGLKKHVEVERLQKGRMQDNLEFLQWCKSHYDKRGGMTPKTYNPIERRALWNGSFAPWVSGGNLQTLPTPESPAVRRMMSETSRAPTLPSEGNRLTKARTNSHELQKLLDETNEVLRIAEQERNYYFGWFNPSN